MLPGGARDIGAAMPADLGFVCVPPRLTRTNFRPVARAISTAERGLPTRAADKSFQDRAASAGDFSLWREFGDAALDLYSP
jgi:hypothetical protein